MTPPVEEMTVQKYDMQFGTNVVGASSFAPFGLLHASLTCRLAGICRPLAVHDPVVARAVCGY